MTIGRASVPDFNRTRVETWILRFRRVYATNTAGLAALSDCVAKEAGEMVTINETAEDGTTTRGTITGNKLEILQACEELLADPLFMAGVTTARRRILIPDYTNATPY